MAIIALNNAFARVITVTFTDKLWSSAKHDSKLSVFHTAFSETAKLIYEGRGSYSDKIFFESDGLPYTQGAVLVEKYQETKQGSIDASVYRRGRKETHNLYTVSKATYLRTLAVSLLQGYVERHALDDAVRRKGRALTQNEKALRAQLDERITEMSSQLVLLRKSTEQIICVSGNYMYVSGACPQVFGVVGYTSVESPSVMNQAVLVASNENTRAYRKIVGDATDEDILNKLRNAGMATWYSARPQVARFDIGRSIVWAPEIYNNPIIKDSRFLSTLGRIFKRRYVTSSNEASTDFVDSTIFALTNERPGLLEDWLVLNGYSQRIVVLLMSVIQAQEGIVWFDYHESTISASEDIYLGDVIQHPVFHSLELQYIAGATMSVGNVRITVKCDATLNADIPHMAETIASMTDEEKRTVKMLLSMLQCASSLLYIASHKKAISKVALDNIHAVDAIKEAGLDFIHRKPIVMRVDL